MRKSFVVILFLLGLGLFQEGSQNQQIRKLDQGCLKFVFLIEKSRGTNGFLHLWLLNLSL